MRWFPLLVLLFLGISVRSQPVILQGTGEGYAGQLLRLTLPGNPVIDRPDYRDTVRCDARGVFRFELVVAEGRMVEIEAGVYIATLFVEPGRTYEVQLPPFREKGYEDYISPYFQALRIPLQPGEPGEVNPQIFQFDSLYAIQNDLVIMSRRLNRDYPLDSAIRNLEEGFRNDTTPFFRDYRRYKYGVLKINEGRTGLEEISRTYLGEEVNEKHPAFMELFGSMYKDFLFYYARQNEGGASLQHHLRRTLNLDSIRAGICSHPSVQSRQMADLILLQELASAFYTGEYHKETILSLLDSLAAYPQKDRFGSYASELRQYLAQLLVGHRPPALIPSGSADSLSILDRWKGKYVYLMFCTPDHYGCMMEYPYLQSFVRKHNAYLEVVTVMVARNRSELPGFMDRNQYEWPVYFYQDFPDVLSLYRVRAFPTAFLIDREGNLLQSPAILPSDGFEQHLFRIMRSRGEI
ncbi:MAG: TlpA disulfide reductase family protein [Bacteroidales bacterium]